ncbi:MAG: creatininase family protein [Candidatus Sumerlaeota bacterium]|nr:creatininase family protein [Candidatus Sumerlaeota bacterium]
MKYEEMNPREIDDVLKTRPLAYLVWGAHEWHGVHNPVGLDTLKAYHMTLDLCRATGGVVLPPVYCGFQTMKPWMGFHHTLEFSKELVTQYVFEHLENLYDEGFKAIVIVMGHYGARHVEAVNAGVARFTERHRYPKVLAIRDFDPAGWVNVKGGDHGGKNETSLMMHYREDLVDLSRLPPGELVHGRDGISPNAKESSTEHGAMLARVFVEQAAPKIRELLETALKEWPTEKADGRGF